MAASTLPSAIIFAALVACAMGFTPAPVFISKSINNARSAMALRTISNAPLFRIPLASRSSALSSISMQAKSPIISSIDKVVKENKIIVFMKGTKDFPQCGFSNTVVQVITYIVFCQIQQMPTFIWQILKASGANFETVNVLENPLIRQGIKEYTNWPTIPQVNSCL
jgi:monothiol glutaredoxin